MEHPTLTSIRDIIFESPHKYNHIYHVLDAADFPLSVIPRLQQYLSLTPQRSRNRRATQKKFYHGQTADITFVITRSDLLAPRKEQVDELMPYLLEVLRQALGFSSSRVRLGNVYCVSSKRGWWTKQLKEEIWTRGGGGWLVGKVNVGKSNLFESIFPKGRHMDLPNAIGQLEQSKARNGLQQSYIYEERLCQGSLLPPVPVETPYPLMPVVSHLPGTTAAPIRLLFGGGKGELVDLPGLPRSIFEKYLQDNHKSDFFMQHRVTPKQYIIKPGQSLLLGGIVRITPTSPEIIVLAYPFVPVQSHVTSTAKAIEIQTQQHISGIPNIARPESGDKIAFAGTFLMKWDVTKKRAGPLTSTQSVNLDPRILPFIVLSTDILIEGCGWVELVAQIRKGPLKNDCQEDKINKLKAKEFPAVDVFSPEGQCVGARQPMNGWILGGPKPIPLSRKRGRPRRSVKGSKRLQKRLSSVPTDQTMHKTP